MPFRKIENYDPSIPGWVETKYDKHNCPLTPDYFGVDLGGEGHYLVSYEDYDEAVHNLPEGKDPEEELVIPKRIFKLVKHSPKTLNTIVTDVTNPEIIKKVMVENHMESFEME